MTDGILRTDRDRQLDRQAFAELAGVDPDSVTRGVRRGTYPQPDGILGGRPWWWESTVDAWVPPRSGRPAGSGAQETHAAGPRT
jgi:hypothetical protein